MAKKFDKNTQQHPGRYIGTAKQESTSTDLTSEVTGVLPVANGGTGVNTLAADSVLTGDGTNNIVAEPSFRYIGNKVLLGEDDDAASNILRISHTDDDGGALNFAAGNGGGTDKDGGDMNFYAGQNTSNGDPGTIYFHASAPSGSSGSSTQSHAEILKINGKDVSGGSIDSKNGVFRGGNIGDIQFDPAAGYFIPISATDWVQHEEEAKRGAVGGIAGYRLASVGYALWYHNHAVFTAFCEKLIPVGFNATSVIVYGSNNGGVGNESQFVVTETALTTNASTTRVTATNWNSSGSLNAAVMGNLNKCLTIMCSLGNKTDVIYGAKIIMAKT